MMGGMRTSRHDTGAAGAAPLGPAGRAARERRAQARARLSRAERREEIYGRTFDFLRAPDVFRLLLRLGAAEIGGGAELGALFAHAPAAAPVVALSFALFAAMLAAGQICAGMALWSLVKALSYFNRRLRRPVYYPAERLRRQRLARERRRVRDRFTLNPCPEPAQLLAQYAKARDGAREAIRFGSMLCDLEAYCDNSLVRNADGEIVGRNPGVKGWLRLHCPELAAHYATVMRYKGIAEKFRQAAGVRDPVPADALADPAEGPARRICRGNRVRKITVRMRKANGDRDGETFSETYTLEADAVEASWRRAQELFAACEAAATAAAGEPTADVKSVRLRCGSTPSAERGEKAKRGRGDEKDGVRVRLRCGSLAMLVAVLDERLAPEFAPSGWKFTADALPGRRMPILASGA